MWKEKKIKNPANDQCLDSIFISFDSQIKWLKRWIQGHLIILNGFQGHSKYQPGTCHPSKSKQQHPRVEQNHEIHPFNTSNAPYSTETPAPAPHHALKVTSSELFAWDLFLPLKLQQEEVRAPCTPGPPSSAPGAAPHHSLGWSSRGSLELRFSCFVSLWLVGSVREVSRGTPQFSLVFYTVARTHCSFKNKERFVRAVKVE